MRLILILSLGLLSSSLYAERPQSPPQNQAAVPSAGRADEAKAHGTERFGKSIVRAGADEVCLTNLSADFDDELLNRLVNVMVSPAHFHTGSAAMAREFLRDAASRDPHLADRILKFSLNAYDATQQEYPGSETGDVLQLVSEVASYLPDGHPLKNPQEVANQLQKHAMDWVGVSIKNAVNKKLPPGLLNIIAGYSRSLDLLDPESRAKALDTFIADLKTKGLGEAESYLLQPLARHFGAKQVKGVLENWRKNNDSTSTIALLANAVSESSDPRVAMAAKVFLEANKPETLALIQEGVRARLKNQKDLLGKSADELRSLNGKIKDMAIQVGLDVAGIIDPSPLCSALSSGYCIYREMKQDDPDYILVTLSLVGMLPAIGKVAKGITIGRQMTKLIKMIEGAKGLLETIMSTRRFMKQSKDAEGFLDYAIQAAGKVIDHKVHVTAQKIPLPVRIGLESFTGLPLTSEKEEPFAAAYIQDAVDNSRLGKKVKEACSAFDRRVNKVKELLSLPGRKIRELVQGKTPSTLAQPQTNFPNDRGVPMSNADYWLAKQIRANYSR